MHRVALVLHIQPPGELGGLLLGQVAVPADDLGELGADPLGLLGAEYLGDRGVGDVDRLGHGHLPVEQLVDPLGRAGPGQRPPDVRLVKHGPAVRPGLRGRPVVHALMQHAEPAGRA